MSCRMPCRCHPPCHAWEGEGAPEEWDVDPEYEAALERQAEERRSEAAQPREEAA